MLLHPGKPERSIEDMILRPQTRMYFLVMYNLSPMQQGIQALHAAVEYGLTYGDNPLYKQWATKDKTVMVMNGGTSNNVDPDWLGTIEMHMETLDALGLPYECFREPDCNHATTAISFVLDETVYDLDKIVEKHSDDVLRIKQPTFGIPVEKLPFVDYSTISESIQEYPEFAAKLDKKLALHRFIKQFRFA